MTNEAPVATTPIGASPNGQPATPPASGGIPAAPESQPKSTVERLFPDFIGENGRLMDKPRVTPGVTPGQILDPNPVADNGGQPPTPAPTAAPGSQYVDLAALEGKMVKLKVDGVEIDVPATSLVKNYQLEAHLTQKGQRLADQEKILQEVLKEAVNRPPASPAAGAPPANPEDFSGDPEVAKIKAELVKTQTELAHVTSLTKNLRVQEGLKQIDNDIRTNVGADDFLSYVPKIQEFIKSQLKDPTRPTQEEISIFDSHGFYKTKYLEMKAKDMVSGKTPVPAAPAAAAQPPASGVEHRPAPNISIESGGGQPAIDRPGNSWNDRYKAALQRATKTGDLNDWATVSRLKHEPVGNR